MNKEMTPEKVIDMFTYQISSKLPVEDIAEKVPAACEQYKFSLLHTYVYHEMLAGKGFPIDRKAYVFEVCQAKIAAGILTSFPNISLFLPCKIVVYEQNGESVISTMNMGAVLNAVRSDAGLFHDATGLFNTLKILIDNISIA